MCFIFDVAKVDRDVAHVAMAIHVCCACCSGYTNMLHVCVPNISAVFRSLLQVYVSKCVSCFKCMLHVFYVNVQYIVVATHICYSKSSMLQVFHEAQEASRRFPRSGMNR
jgi:hypothetical protein